MERNRHLDTSVAKLIIFHTYKLKYLDVVCLFVCFPPVKNWRHLPISGQTSHLDYWQFCDDDMDKQVCVCDLKSMFVQEVPLGCGAV